MRIERVTRSRHKKGRVLVTLADGACLPITEREWLDFSLCAGDELDQEQLARLKEAAGVSDARSAAAALIGRRAMSRRELMDKLQAKGSSEAEARYAAEWLESIGALDDAAYAAALVRHCAAQGYGPARYREELRKRGVDRSLWEDALAQAPAPEEVIERYLQGRFRRHAPDAAECRRAADALARRGFSWGEVRAALTSWVEASELGEP